MIYPLRAPNVIPVKAILTASLVVLLLPSCGLFKKKEEIGPYGDNRSRWQKLRTYEEERYDGWADKWMHREEYKRRKAAEGKKRNP
ncbi:MAG: hypothetical protein ACI9UA_004347 [Pseudoalteromonas tetraodonis]